MGLGLASKPLNSSQWEVTGVARVQIGEAVKHMGLPAIIVGIQKQPGANTLELMRALVSAWLVRSGFENSTG